MGTIPRTVCFMVSIFLLINISSFSQNKITQEKVTIKNIIGKAEVRSPTTGKWRSARVGMVIKPKWDVRTYVESSLELVFESGTVIKLGENSVVNLSILLKNISISASNSKIKVASGQIMANVKKMINKKSKFEFETPTAVASIRGTILGIIVQKNKTVVDVYKGRVVVRKKGTRKEKFVTTRNRAVVNEQESEVIMYKFEEIQQISDSLNMVPIQTDLFVVDSSMKIDSIKTDTLTIDTVLTDTVITDSVNADTLTIETIKIDTIETDGIESGIDSNSSYLTDDIGHDIDSPEDKDEINIEHEKQLSNFLSITKPTDNMVLQKPVVFIEGLTLPVAEVTVDDIIIPVRADGSFSYKVYIPDEAGLYSFVIISKYMDKETNNKKTVEFRPVREELTLHVSSPVNGQVINNAFISVAGKAISGAKIEISAGGGRYNKFLSTSTGGSFSCNIPVYEQDIGEYLMEIVASDGETGHELEKIISLTVNGQSPAINKSVPDIDVTGTSQGATKTGSFIIRVADQTFNDIIVLSVKNNGSEEKFTLERSDQEKIFLDEGRNMYTINARDMAGNTSNTISGEIFYLPGPLKIDIIKPDESMYSIEDLPPMPLNTGKLSMDIKVIIDDNIGDVPQSILYCRVNGVNLKAEGDYTYIGNLKVSRGSNLFLIETEDIAGNKTKKSFTIIINE